MIAQSVRHLLEKLNKYNRSLLEGAVGSCVTRTHYEVTLSHFLAQAFEEGHGDLLPILAYFKVDPGLFRNALQQDLKEVRAGNTGKPIFSPNFLQALELAWAESSLNLSETAIRTGGLILALRKNPSYVPPALADQIALINPEVLMVKFAEITAGSKESQEGTKSAGSAEASGAEGSALARFTLNFTDMARQGKIDPVFGRDDEIRQAIDILSRRRKNNPIFIGEAGVGKTAVIEGLALRIAEGNVPDMLKEVDIRSLDLGLLQAGAGVRGEFENRLKSVIREVKESAKPIILFIDEAHTLIGAGGEAGQGDAANLLKPELARGELKVLAATTFSEFRKYFEKDPAMARRFQAVRIEEPDAATASIMLRGLRTHYEKFHGVKITYEGIQAACDLSSKFIPGRQLPDKAVDLLDTAAARVKMGLTSKPAALVTLEQARENLKIEITALEKDKADGVLKYGDALDKAKARVTAVEAQIEDLTSQWQEQLSRVRAIMSLQEKIQEAQGEGKTEAADALRAELDLKWKDLEENQGDNTLVHAHVSRDVVAQIVSEWTGVPAGSMLKNEAQLLLELESTIAERVVGQDLGVAEIASTLRSAKLGLGNPESPLGVFLVTGPSGVGKTEAARAISDILFGGEKAVVTINMSEYQDSMSITQLKGASAGYVGYGEGGVLTEGVRKRPYTVVILDEVEKAHKDILTMFYQVFDKGILRDGEGRDISFRNAVIIMTSNLGLETITQMSDGDRENALGLDDYREFILDELTAHFSPALLARCKVVPFLPLSPENLQRIVFIKLMKVGNRLMEKHRMAFAVSPHVVRNVVMQCTTAQSGARNIDSIIDQKLLPEISRGLLSQLAEGKAYTHLYVGADDKGGFTYYFSVGDFDAPELTEDFSGEESEASELNGVDHETQELALADGKEKSESKED